MNWRIKDEKILALILLIMLTIFAAACSEASDTDSADGDKSSDKGDKTTVSLYTSESQDLVGEMMNKFKEEHPDVEVEIFRTGTEELIAKLEAERSAGGIKADMVWFADIDYFNTLNEEGLLEEYQSPNAEDIDEEFVYDNGKYYEVRQIFNVLAYNTAQVKDPLTSWKDLYRDDLKGKIAIASPDYSGAAFLTLATLAENDDLGMDYYKSLKENGVKFEQVMEPWQVRLRLESITQFLS